MKERNISYDIVRVVSMCFVISVHLLAHLSNDTELRIFMSNTFYQLFFTCNGIFYMLSGKFALQEKCDSAKEYFNYYYKKLWGLLVPIVLYMFLRYTYDTNYAFSSEGFLTGFWQNFSSGYSSNEYWYLYALVGSILAAPFIGKALQNTSKTGLWIFLAIGLFFNTMWSYMPLFGYEWAWKYPFESWIFYFCLGYCVDRLIHSKKQRIAVYIVGVTCFVISMLQKYGGGVTRRIYDLAPTMTCITCMIYVLLKSIKIKNNTIKTILTIVAIHSFGVYMGHMRVLRIVVDWRPMGENFYMEYLITTTIMVLLMSLAVSFIFDSIVVFPLKKYMIGLLAKDGAGEKVM